MLKANIISILICFGFLVSGLYQFGYWSTFEINIFPLMNIQDIVMGSIYPIIRTAPFFILGLLVGSLQSSAHTRNASITPASTTSRKKVFSWLSLLILFFSSLYVFTSYNEEPFLSTSLYLMVISAAGLFGGSDMLLKYLPNYKKWYLVFWALIGIAAFSYISGKKEGNFILKNQDYQYTRSSFLKSQIGKKEQIVKYLGAVGDSYIFLTKDNEEKIVVNKEELKELVLSESK